MTIKGDNIEPTLAAADNRPSPRIIIKSDNIEPTLAAADNRPSPRILIIVFICNIAFSFTWIKCYYSIVDSAANSIHNLQTIFTDKMRKKVEIM